MLRRSWFSPSVVSVTSGDYRPELEAGSGLVRGCGDDEDSGEDTDDLIEDARNFVTIGRRWANKKRKKEGFLYG